jgi:hypothetical protein
VGDFQAAPAAQARRDGERFLAPRLRLGFQTVFYRLLWADVLLVIHPQSASIVKKNPSNLAVVELQFLGPSLTGASLIHGDAFPIFLAPPQNRAPR